MDTHIVAASKIQRQQVDLAERSVRVAKKAADRVHLVGPCHHAHAVAQFQHGVAMRDEVLVAAPHARHKRAEALGQIEIAQPASGERGL